jgi:hypothetical protein
MWCAQPASPGRRPGYGITGSMLRIELAPQTRTTGPSRVTPYEPPAAVSRRWSASAARGPSDARPVAPTGPRERRADTRKRVLRMLGRTRRKVPGGRRTGVPRSARATAHRARLDCACCSLKPLLSRAIGSPTTRRTAAAMVSKSTSGVTALDGSRWRASGPSNLSRSYLCAPTSTRTASARVSAPA